MTGKTPIIAMLAALSLAACTSVRETPAPPAQTVATTAPDLTPQPAPKPTPPQAKPRPAPRPSTTRASPTTSTTPPPTATAINARVSREPGGNSLLVTRGTTAEPVPLFRQAIVLANVRAAVAGLPAQPKAEFQRGLLTLTFPRGTQPEVAAAINRAIELPEVNRLRVIPPP
jgi:outer membrane biosynthesis protein TonB